MLALRSAIDKQCTVMFCDLRESSFLADTLKPALLMSALHRFLLGIAETTVAYGGTTVGCMGDGAVALFESPERAGQHAAFAVAAAREIATTRQRRFNEWLAQRGVCRSFGVGVGLSSGRVLLVEVDGEHASTIEPIGRATHTAARLEELTKQIDRPVLLDGPTQELAGGAGLEYVGRRLLRGQSEPTEVWAAALTAGAYVGRGVRTAEALGRRALAAR